MGGTLCKIGSPLLSFLLCSLCTPLQSRIKKVTALLEELGIQNREMDSKFEFDLESMKNEINYDAVYRVINEKRQSSKQYLKDAIGMAKQ